MTDMRSAIADEWYWITAMVASPLVSWQQAAMGGETTGRAAQPAPVYPAFQLQLTIHNSLCVAANGC